MTTSAAQRQFLDQLLERWHTNGEHLADKLGIELTETDPNHFVATMPVHGNRQPYGLLHGGASAVLAETVGSLAAAMHAGADSIAVGIELSCSHHRSATEGVVTAVCTPLRVGRTISSFQIMISDDQDRLVCSARLTCAIRPAYRAGLSVS